VSVTGTTGSAGDAVLYRIAEYRVLVNFTAVRTHWPAFAEEC
jgi:hypothetical protein